MSISLCGAAADSLGREDIQHGSTAFPLACYEDEVSRFFVPWHWHEEFECIVAISGVIPVDVKGARVLLQPGQGCFLNSGVLHSVARTEGNPAVLRSVVFHPRLAGESAESVFWQDLIQPLLQDRDFRWLKLEPQIPWQKAVMDQILEAWHAVVFEEEDHQNLARYRLCAALRLLVRNRPSQPLSRQDRLSAQRLKQMLRFIQLHYAEELTVERIAATVSVSGSVCLRCFRQILGMSPMQYVIQLRVERAAELLLTTDRKINAIALDCGFSDMSYFTRTFRERKGCTPRQYRGRFRAPPPP